MIGGKYTLVVRICLFGGTFDPPHLGHAVLVEQAHAQLEVDKLLVMVSGQPWQKSLTRTVTPGIHRFEMTRLALADIAGVEVSDLEVTRNQNSYTIDTVEELLRLYGSGTEIVVLLGSDAFSLLPTWHRWPDLMRLVSFALVDREAGTAMVATDLPVQPSQRVLMPRVEISSTDLRESFNVLQPQVAWLHKDVLRYIRSEGLYS